MKWVDVGMVADGSRVGAPGTGVLIISVDVFVAVGESIEDNSRVAFDFPSAKEIARPPPIMVIEMRAARNPEISSRRSFIRELPPQNLPQWN
jgi:hypothetical protein